MNSPNTAITVTHSHTPGPWTCKVGVMGPYVNQETKTIQPHYVVNPTGNGCPTISQDEAWANARLIAAAPDLLAAAKAILQAHPIMYQSPNTEPTTIMQLASAIAKAEGVTNAR